MDTLNNHDFISLSVSDGTSIDVYIAHPDTEPKKGAIILFQEAFGVNAHIQQVAEKLCKEGYWVLAPDLFHRTIRRADFPYTDFELIKPHFMAITFDNVKLDAEACYQYLVSKELGFKPDQIASLGFCLGGRVSFWANSFLRMACGISYYGGGLENFTHLAKEIGAPHLFFWGGRDKGITKEKRDSIMEAMEEAEKTYTSVLFSYADHAFDCTPRPNFNPEASAEAWTLTLAFLSKKLGG